MGISLVHLVVSGLFLPSSLAIFSPASVQQSSQRIDALVVGRLPENLQVREIAKQVTVRILTDEGGGSGVIVRRRGSVYTVLTCEHVVTNGSGNEYPVLTADGVTYRGRWQRRVRFRGLDLALIEFSSQKSYRVAILGNSNHLVAGDRLYAAGFPNYYSPANRKYLESTYNWGMRAFLLTTGEFSNFSRKSLARGYSLGYTNEVKDGMSGGPVLNQRGELVGVNGRLKYPLQGSDVFVFTDGTRPSPEQFRQMEALSWAIPITSVRQLLRTR